MEMENPGRKKKENRNIRNKDKKNNKRSRILFTQISGKKYKLSKRKIGRKRNFNIYSCWKDMKNRVP
ncbi:hypothetical protein MSWHS_3306 [Methanosarcina sp. WWM596]|nr:hypothetical protein MSWHS_3306 [Methanosarcina sp. WWM596]AKB23368.1 hypothetical protein MSWH1_3097 [Methanosarcina sp. WH1]